MIGTVRLPQWILFWQVVFTATTGFLVAELGPRLLLLDEAVARATSRSFLLAIVLGGAASLVYSAISLRRHRFRLRALALGTEVVSHELGDLESEPWRTGLVWAIPTLIAIAIAAGPARSALLNVRESASFGLLAASFVATATLLLITISRRSVVHALELAPTSAMHELITQTERARVARRLLPRRLSLAFAIPVAFVSIGAALIVNAHLRRSEEMEREHSARALARAAFEQGPGLIPSAGMVDAALDARTMGFSVSRSDHAAAYEVTRERDGVISLSMPLDHGSARVRFSGSSVGVLGGEALLVALIAVGIAALLGWLLGSALSADLKMATDSVRLLGTETRAEPLRSARFRSVEELSRAITGLARRFRVFARAQERAIAARESAARARGLLFASVSHDLRSPLNAILGFTELARLEDVSPEQEMSLDIIERRGRELLALIETILDAARLDAQRLSLMREPVNIGGLLGDAASKARDLAGEREMKVVVQVAPDLPRVVVVDSARVARAIGMLIGHAMRSADRSPIDVRADLRGADLVIEIDVISQRVSAQRLESMLGATTQSAGEQHRGLALGLRLARTVIELHSGTVTVVPHDAPGARFVVVLPTTASGDEPPPSSRRFA